MTLRRITLRDFVIVSELELDFGSGFTALTGETGAGKSILVDALQLALGARADAAVVRQGATRCDISAEFDTPPTLREWLQQAGLEADDTLLLRRTVDAQGKSRGWINGTPVTAAQLREAGENLVDIHGQHAWQGLTRAASVRDLLDAFAGADTATLAAGWQQWRAARAALEQAQTATSAVQDERERLQWQIAEVEKLSPAADEWAELNARHSRLANAQALMDAAQQAALALHDDDRYSAAALLSQALAQLQAQQHIEPEFAAVAEVLASALAQAEDAVHSLHAWLRSAEMDPQELAALDERVGAWLSLSRRFRCPPQELPQVLQGWRARLRELDAAVDMEALQAAERKGWQALLKAAAAVSATRSRAAGLLAQSVTQAMQTLGMPGGCFEVMLSALPQPASYGAEDVLFLVSTNPGVEPRPLSKVASGGELSRLALAIAITASAPAGAPTLVFDEIDSGIGGGVAETVGRLMRQLGQDRQVLAVTHLPQVAACAQHHLVVSKQEGGSSVAPALGEGRVAEIARMLGGERITDTTLAHAAEMLAPYAVPHRKSTSA